MILKPMIKGLLGMLALLAVYFSITAFVSGWNFALQQFSQFRYFVIGLALGFGVQIGLYTYLKQEIKNRNMAFSGRALAFTGTTSTLAMVSCCAHYLANIIPILGVAGALTIISQYQIELFWVGLIFNALGVTYIANRIIKFKKQA